jgi:1-acyl-sn-glycerol-3-phosphate acyltransferase
VKAQKTEKYPPRVVQHFLRSLSWLVSKPLWFIRFHGRENIPPKDSGGYIIASNHQSYLDPGWVCIPIKQKLRFMAFDEAFGWKFIGPAISYLGAFPVPLNGKAALKPIKEALRALEDGAALLVFPEGGRQSADGKLQPLKEGVARIAIQASASILPVTITGGNRIWPIEQKYPRVFRRVEVTYHPLLQPDETDTPETLTEKLRAAIASA